MIFATKMSCVFGSAVAIRLLILSILPSLLDLSTDILNALDMILSSLGYCFDCNDPFLKSLINMCKDNSTCPISNIGSSALSKPTMGYISIVIIFFPGMVKAFYHVMVCLQKDEYKKVPKALCYLPFPLYLLFKQMKAILNPLDPVAEQDLIRVLSMEAFYESFPQLVLQMISIIYSYNLTYVQALSIAFSLLMLAKTVILLDSAEPIRVVRTNVEESSRPANDVHDIENSNENTMENVNQKEQDVGKNKVSGYCTTALSALLSTLKYMVWVLPLYLTSIIFKIAAFSITIAYLRIFACVTMGLLIIELFVLAKYTGFKKFADQIYPVLSNFFIVNIGGAHIRQKQVMNKEELEQYSTQFDNMYKFAKRSVTLSYLHHTMVLVLIAILVVNVGKMDENRKPDVNETIFSQEFHCNETLSCVEKAIQSTIADLKVHWNEMHEWLYPYCKYKNCGQNGLITEIMRLTMEDKMEEKKWKNPNGEWKIIAIEEYSKIYPFMIIIASVILVGLLNLMLSIYSARDIKARNRGQLDATQEDETRSEVHCAKENESSDDYRLVRGLNGFISIENNEIIFKIKQSTISNMDCQPSLPSVTICNNGLSKQEVKEDSKVFIN